VTLLEGTEKRWWLGYAHYTLAWISLATDDFDLALEACAQVDAIGETIGDRRLRATAASMTGTVYTVTGEYDLAIEAHQRGLELSPDPFETALFLGFLGSAYLGKGDLAQAILVLEQAVPQANQYRSRQVQAWFRCFLAEAYLFGLAGGSGTSAGNGGLGDRQRHDVSIHRRVRPPDPRACRSVARRLHGGGVLSQRGSSGHSLDPITVLDGGTHPPGPGRPRPRPGQP